VRVFTTQAQIAANAPRYSNVITSGNVNTASVTQALRWPVGCTASNLRVSTEAGVTGTPSISLAKGVNATTVAATPLACTFTAGGTSCSSAATVTINAGDYIVYYVDNTSGVSTSFFFNFTCQ